MVRRCPNRDGCPLASPCVGKADGGAPRARLLRGARGGDSIPVPTRVPLRGESGRRGPVPTKLRRWLLRGRPENHQTGRCGMRAGKSLVDRGYTHGDWLQLRRDLSSSTHVRQRGGASGRFTLRSLVSRYVLATRKAGPVTVGEKRSPSVNA